MTSSYNHSETVIKPQFLILQCVSQSMVKEQMTYIKYGKALQDAI